jgi:hypothetical protein
MFGITASNMSATMSTHRQKKKAVVSRGRK